MKNKENSARENKYTYIVHTHTFPPALFLFYPKSFKVAIMQKTFVLNYLVFCQQFR